MWRRTVDCLGVAVEITSRVAELDGLLDSVFGTYAEAGGPPALDYALEVDGLALVRDGQPVRRCRVAIDLVAVLELDLYRQVLARAKGILLHAGAVVGAGGQALVFAGRSGAGKSTLVRALLGRGFLYLSEECVALVPGGACRGLARSLHVDDDRVTPPPGYASGEYPIRRESGEVRVTRLLRPPESAIWRGAARTAAVVAIAHAPGGVSRLEPLGGGAALALLWPAVFRPDEAAVAAAGAALDGVARYHLHTSSPEDAIARALALAADLGVEARQERVSKPRTEPEGRGETLLIRPASGSVARPPAMGAGFEARSQLARMRAFAAALLSGAPADAPRDAPAELIEKGHLGPIAYKIGDTRFRDVYAASAVMAARRAAIQAEIVAALVARGVRVALIKGVAYAGTIYPDPAERPMLDIDLLVPRRETPEAMRALARLGIRRLGSLRRRSRYYHAIEIRRGDLIVELHRSVMQHYRTDIRMGDVWRRAGPDPSAGGAWRLDPVDDALLCILHIARHELAVPALNYLDVRRLWNRLDDDARRLLRARAAEYRVARPVAAVLSMTEHLAAGRPGRPDISGGRFLQSADHILLGLGPTRLRQIGQKLLLTDGVREALGLGVAYPATALVDGWRRSRQS